MAPIFCAFSETFRLYSRACALGYSIIPGQRAPTDSARLREFIRTFERALLFLGGRMKVRGIVLALVAFFATSVLASAQSQTGEIFGKVTDQSGAVLPGVTVTLTGPVLLQPLTAVTSETGTYQFPRLEIGSCAVKFDLAGFKTVVNEDVRVTVGFSAQVNATLGVSTVQETITVTGASPV